MTLIIVGHIFPANGLATVSAAECHASSAGWTIGTCDTAVSVSCGWRRCNGAAVQGTEFSLWTLQWKLVIILLHIVRCLFVLILSTALLQTALCCEIVLACKVFALYLQLVLLEVSPILPWISTITGCFLSQISFRSFFFLSTLVSQVFFFLFFFVRAGQIVLSLNHVLTQN